MAKFDKYGFITELDDNEIFVFGSNLAGRHGAGAAKQAALNFEAEYGVGEGLTGRCYAFPTLDKMLKKLPWERLVVARGRFYVCARENQHLLFYLTKVGCGLAGYNEQQMASLFYNMPENVTLPQDWM